MRKLLLALACLFSITGVIVAAEVVLVKYDSDKKEVTVKEGDVEKTYKLTDKTKISITDKSGVAKEATLEAAAKLLGNDKAKGKLKFEISADKEDLTELKLKARKKN